MGIFHSYVKLPEGNVCSSESMPRQVWVKGSHLTKQAPKRVLMIGSLLLLVTYDGFVYAWKKIPRCSMVLEYLAT
jgi:hypothetical protein